MEYPASARLGRNQAYSGPPWQVPGRERSRSPPSHALGAPTFSPTPDEVEVMTNWQSCFCPGEIYSLGRCENAHYGPGIACDVHWELSTSRQKMLMHIISSDHYRTCSCRKPRSTHAHYAGCWAKALDGDINCSWCKDGQCTAIWV